MAQYKHLPIYKVTYELLEQITRVTKDFPRKRFANALRLAGHRVHRDLTRVIA